jgi:hypothetical protein
MLPYRHSRITQIVLIIFFIVLLLYAYYEARGLLFGPQISISSDSPTTVTSQYVLITGATSYISSLSVDGEQIPVTESGAFSEAYLLAPGENYIYFDAKDNWGRTREKVIEIYYATPATTTTTSTPPQASSSPSIAPGE